jgi:hypothetical protein
MRTFFLTCGLITSVPQIWFLFLQRKLAEPMLPYLHTGKHLLGRQPRRWWLATALRTMSIAMLGTGSRLFVVNAMNIDKPMVLGSWAAASYAAFTVALSAVASVMFLAVYMRYRDWEV